MTWVTPAEVATPSLALSCKVYNPGALKLAWVLPEAAEEDTAAEALVTGTILGSYHFDRFKSKGTGSEDPSLWPSDHVGVLADLSFGG